jgi:hypothetical protein
MRSKIDFIVCICMMIALYVNLTDYPKPQHSRTASGLLIKQPTLLIE